MTDTAIIDSDDIFNAEAYPHLAAAGYQFTYDGICIPGSEFEVIEQEEVNQLEDALFFLDYIAEAIDSYHGLETDKCYDFTATERFENLLYALPDDYRDDGFISDAVPDTWRVFFYIAMRRFQREERLDRMRTALGLFMVYDNGTFTGRDLISVIAPDLVALHDKIHATPDAKAA